MKIPKVGTVYYSCTATEAGKVELDEWHVRTIRGGRATAILHIQGITWVKLSTKHFDWGWTKSIAPWMRHTWTIGQPLRHFFSTKRQAYADALEEVEEGYVTDDATIKATLIAKLKARLKRKA